MLTGRNDKFDKILRSQMDGNGNMNTRRIDIFELCLKYSDGKGNASKGHNEQIMLLMYLYIYLIIY